MELNTQNIDDLIIFKPINFQNNYSRFDSDELTIPVTLKKVGKRSQLCRNILFIITLVQFLLIVALCTVSGLFSDQVCQLLTNIEKDHTTDSETNCLATGIKISCILVLLIVFNMFFQS